MRVSMLARRVVIAAPLLLGGCSAQSAGVSQDSAPSIGAQPALSSRAFASDLPVESQGIEVVGVTESGLSKYTDPTYGEIWAYERGTKAHVTHVVLLTSGQKVVFKNIDAEKGHTVAFLGNASQTGAPWPASFDGGTKQSPAGTAVGTAGWNTGRLDMNANSLVYNTGAPGFYMIGCQYHYKYGMRNVLIVQ